MRRICDLRGCGNCSALNVLQGWRCGIRSGEVARPAHICMAQKTEFETMCTPMLWAHTKSGDAADGVQHALDMLSVEFLLLNQINICPMYPAIALSFVALCLDGNYTCAAGDGDELQCQLCEARVPGRQGCRSGAGWREPSSKAVCKWLMHKLRQHSSNLWRHSVPTYGHGFPASVCINMVCYGSRRRARKSWLLLRHGDLDHLTKEYLRDADVMAGSRRGVGGRLSVGAAAHLQLRQDVAVRGVAGQAQHHAHGVGAQAVDHRRGQARPPRQQPQQHLRR